jgi:hypothetical protein
VIDRDAKSLLPIGSIEAASQDSEDDNEDILDILRESIQDILNRLFRLSVKIRNPITRLESSKARSYRLFRNDADVFDVEFFGAVEHFDLDYVRSVFLEFEKSKIQQGLEPAWGLRQPKSSNVWHDPSQCKSCQSSLDEIRYLEHKQLMDLPEHYLVRRIARANVRRRQQFAYWTHHKSKVMRLTDDANKSLHAAEAARIDLSSESPVSGAQGLATIHEESITTATLLPHSLHNIDDLASETTVSRYKKSPEGEKIVFPEPPDCPEVDEYFECPFCHIMCQRKTLNESAWK